VLKPQEVDLEACCAPLPSSFSLVQVLHNLQLMYYIIVVQQEDSVRRGDDLGQEDERV
jgi:hypothetical protein